MKPYKGAQRMSTATSSINVAIPHGSPAQRVAAHVESTSLDSLRSRDWRRDYRVDLLRPAENLLLHGQRLVIVQYLTVALSAHDRPMLKTMTAASGAKPPDSATMSPSPTDDDQPAAHD